MPAPGDEKNRRFYLWIAAQVVAFATVFGLTVVATERMKGGLGIAIAIVGGICLGLALLLGRAVATDWLNLRVLRRALVRAPDDFRPDEIVAFSGIARTEGPPLTSPFGGHRCCAYSYLVAGRRQASGPNATGTRRANSLQGFALAPSVVEGATLTVRLRALPEVETDLREVETGGDWGEAAHRRVRAAAEGARNSEREGFGSLLVARAGPVEPGSREVFFGSFGGPGDLTVEEDHVPVDEPVCVIGTAEADPPGLSGRRARFGPNLVVYRGTPDEVLERVGAETRGWLRALAVLLALAAVGLLPAFLPEAWVAALPGIRNLVGPG